MKSEKQVSAMPKAKLQTINGRKIAEPRLTITAVWLAFLWIGLPILLIGGVLDLIAQFAFGYCTGLWCFVD